MARILVTGASTGLGLLTATTLTGAGHEVILHARAASRLDCPSAVRKMHGTVYGDLSTLDAVRGIAEEMAAYGRLDAVIHNAGVLDGPELIPVNVVAPYALTALMERPGRVIVLSSGMHRSGSPRNVTDSLAGTHRASYSDSKLWITAFALGLARRWPGVLVHAVDPGWVPTRMGGPSATDDLTEGHQTQEWLATAPADQIVPRAGGYWHHRSARRPHPAALDGDFQDKVFAALAAHTGETVPPGSGR